MITEVEGRLGGFGDDRIAFGSIVDVEKIPSGWAVLDGINNHIVLVTGDLIPERIVGREGEGPGEFKSSPSELALVGDTIAVLQTGSGGQLSYLGPQGGFLRVSGHVGHKVFSFAIHPRLGRFYPVLSASNYLVHAAEGEDPRRIARIPAAFVPEIRGSAGAMGLTPNLVSVTPDGRVHVLDDKHLAVVSYDPNYESPGRIGFLPRKMRDHKIEERRENASVTWGGGYEELMIQTVTMMETMPDGRIVIHLRYGTIEGYVLDPGSLTATPIVVTSGHRAGHVGRLSNPFIKYFDGTHLVVRTSGLTAELVLARTELVPWPTSLRGGR